MDILGLFENIFHEEQEYEGIINSIGIPRSVRTLKSRCGHLKNGAIMIFLTDLNI